MVAALALLAAASTAAWAQSESGVRGLNKDAFMRLRLWHDSTTGMYQTRYPIIRRLPPIDASMPPDVRAAYRHLDSIARFDTTRLTLRRVEGWKAMNDTLRGMLRDLYRLTEYNPIIFHQYLAEINLKSGRRYTANMSRIVEELKEAMLRAASGSADRLALYSALYPDYILRVHVVSIDSMLGKPVPSPTSPYVCRARVTVLDTLKGKAFRACEPRLAYRGGSHGSTRQGSAPCFDVEWYAGNYLTGNQSEPILYPLKDSAFLAHDGGFRLQAGQEAIVFIGLDEHLYDSTADFFHNLLQLDASYNALPVINGMVRDMNHVWSDQTELPYDVWRRRFTRIREKILTGMY